MNTKKKVLIAEVIVVIAMLLALILPRVIGDTQIEATDGYITTIDTLNGHTIGMTNNGEEKDIVADYLPDSKQIQYETISDGIKAIEDKEIDAFACYYDDAREIADNNDDLVIYQLPFARKNKNEVEIDEFCYFVVRKVDCAYHFTTKSLDGIFESGVRIACLSGTSVPDKFIKMNPDCVIEYYDTLVDVYSALSKNKVDFAFGYNDNVIEMLPSFPNLASIPQPIATEKSCFALSKTEKGNALTTEFNTYLNTILASGKYNELVEKWKYGDKNSPDYKLEEVNLTGENGTLSISTNCTWFPYSFYNDSEVSGAFIDVCNLFCEEKGYIPQYSISNFVGEIAGLASGEYDMMADLCEPTDERKLSVNFSSTVFTAYNMVVVRSDDAPVENVSKASVFINTIKNNLYKNLIEQDRYKLILDGLYTTIKISLLAAVFGTILGMLICVLRMSNNVLLSAFARIYIKLVQGMPIVVSLLILYYVVFSESSITGFWVSIIAFSIDFSAYVAEIFRSGIEAIPKGQTLAARALGFSSAQSFFKVVFPQALVNIIPVFSGQFISMVKLTSVVGYIAVQDLTKMSDLIRSSTYEAFFPLITTAAIYFVLSSIFIRILKFVTRKLDPLKRSRIPKGVKTDVI